MGWVRSVTNHAEFAAGATTIPVTLNGIPPGALVVVVLTCISTSNITDVADDLAAAAQVRAAGLDSTGGQKKEIWRFLNHAGGNRTITATFNNSAIFRGIVAMAYTGGDPNPDDGVVVTNQNSSAASPASSGLLVPAPSTDGTLIVAGIAAQVQPAFVVPFSDVFQDTTNLGDTSDYIQPTAAPIAAQFSYAGSTTWTAVAASFKAGALVTPQRRPLSQQQRRAS